MLPTGTHFGHILGILGSKNQTRKFGKIHHDFELY